MFTINVGAVIISEVALSFLGFGLPISVPSKTRVGYEIDFNRYFYIYTAPRPLAEIEGELTQIERDIADMLAEVTE